MIRICVFAAMLSMAVSGAEAQSAGPADSVRIDSLVNMSFADLMNVSVITATKTPQPSDQAPASVAVITRHQIELRGYRNLAEVLNDLPDFMINNKSDPQFHNQVGSRGIFRQDYFVILLDGMRISSPTNEPLPILQNFPIYLARQIEVVYGPGSALYGADAMAGVINIITDDPKEEKSIVSVTGGTQGYGNVTAMVSRRLKNDVTLSLAGQYCYDAQPDFSKIYKEQFNIDSYRTGVFNTSYGPMHPTTAIDPVFEAPITSHNLYTSVEKGGFALKILNKSVSVPTSTGLTTDDAVYNKDVFYQHNTTTANAGFTISMGKIKSTSILDASIYKVNPKSNYRNLYGGMEPGYKYSTGSVVKLDEQINYTFSKKANVVGGITYEQFYSIPKTPELENPFSSTAPMSAILLNSIAANNPSGIQAQLFPIAYRNVGSYVQLQFSPGRRFAFTGGLRYDNNSRFGSTINPRVGVLAKPFNGTTVKAIYATAYWAPSPMVSFESYGSFYTLDSGRTYRSDYWHLPNPGLKPVTSRTVEVSVLQKLGNKWNATLTAYASQIDNLIQDVPDNGYTNLYNNKFMGWTVNYIDVPFNQGRQKNYGGNMTLTGTFTIDGATFNPHSSVSYLQGFESDHLDHEGRFEQGQIVPWQFRAGFDVTVRDFYFSARLLTTSRQRTSREDPANPYDRVTISGYSLLNGSCGYSFGKTTTVFVTVSNALDSRFQNTLGWDSEDFLGSFQDPIRVMAGLRVHLP